MVKRNNSLMPSPSRVTDESDEDYVRSQQERILREQEAEDSENEDDDDFEAEPGAPQYPQPKQSPYTDDASRENWIREQQGQAPRNVVITPAQSRPVGMIPSQRPQPPQAKFVPAQAPRMEPESRLPPKEPEAPQPLPKRYVAVMQPSVLTILDSETQQPILPNLTKDNRLEWQAAAFEILFNKMDELLAAFGKV